MIKSKKYSLTLLISFFFLSLNQIYAQNNVLFLKRKLDALERKIDLKNRDLISVIIEIKNLEKEVSFHKDKTHEKRAAIKREYEESKKIMDRKAFLAMVDGHNPEDLIIQDSLNAHLEDSLQSIRRGLKELKIIEDSLSRIITKIKTLKKKESDVSKEIGQLERRKLLSSKKYIAYKERPGKKKEKKVHLAGIKRFFPVFSYKDLSYQRKGISFSLKKGERIFSPDKGKIIFLGRIDELGNVLMIEHARDIKTVIMGDFDELGTNEGMIVQKRKVLGVMKSSSVLYYELRKKNTALNTVAWLKGLKSDHF